MPTSIDRRQLLHGVLAGAALATLRPHTALAQVPDLGREAMARAATAFLGALDAPRRRRAVFPFADAERRN
jgi:hypothetical protein